MAERTLRGSRMVSHSLETDEHVVPSERQITSYVCPQGHRTELPFSIEAEIPPTWECRCGEVARLVDGPEPDLKPVKHQRTHWDMLLERRSIPELEQPGARVEYRGSAPPEPAQEAASHPGTRPSCCSGADGQAVRTATPVTTPVASASSARSASSSG